MNWPAARIAQLIEATWPPASSQDLGPFRLRDGAGGGKRVSAASLQGDWHQDQAALIAAEAAMPAPLFTLYQGDEALDQALAARGYQVVDPVVIYAAAPEKLQRELPPLSAFAHWPPLEVAREIWQSGGIGPARVAVMERVLGPKTCLLGRHADRPLAAAFVAISEGRAMLHALEVSAPARRQGIGGNLLAAAADWAVSQGADSLSLAVTAQNTAARALYERAGMVVVGKYHYRSLEVPRRQG
ncbi:GNAT family N-acetyltransferase [Xinfangfangia sp. D13-10-4-6]|uniref:GNAT family N-acetyltransferase n=1 Tax=Pseudogemmobacter hezensis TaxID=2737662 RepID=UPI0015554519|nr:GNAT family N-acetyltransferase [Pseudogemmobacter hezensis]NPD14514.1 GNAT family N-acetyltransferase [Pseudogemmobacter hezensis]